MRETLDETLEQIGSTFLTTAEWTTAAGVLNGQTDLAAQYKALRTVLISRGGEDSALSRLKDYFRARGLTPSQLGEPKPAFSNIFIGAPL